MSTLGYELMDPLGIALDLRDQKVYSRCPQWVPSQDLRQDWQNFHEVSSRFHTEGRPTRCGNISRARNGHIAASIAKLSSQ